MCWITFKQPQVKVAKRNIKVLKVVYIRPSNPMKLLPYYFVPFHTYTFNGENPTILINIQKKELVGYEHFNEKFYYSIHEGYHSYSTKCTYTTSNFSIYPNNIIINDIYIYVDDTFTRKRVHLVECIIPKGVKYYINERKEYVSENIIIKRILI